MVKNSVSYSFEHTFFIYVIILIVQPWSNFQLKSSFEAAQIFKQSINLLINPGKTPKNISDFNSSRRIQKLLSIKNPSLANDLKIETFRMKGRQLFYFVCRKW